MRRIKIRCPKCGFGKSIPTKTLPDKPRFKALCPKCEERFSVELQSSRNSSGFNFKALDSKKVTAASLFILLTVVALGSFYIGQKSSPQKVVQATPKPPIEVAAVVPPIKVKKEAKKEPQIVTLQCSGEEQMIDFSPSKPNGSEDLWQAGPWPFSASYKLTLDEKSTGIELFLDSRDEFVELACRGAEEYCSEQQQSSDLAVTFNMKLGQDNNYYSRELTINRTDGALLSTVTMTGGSLRNSIVQTGACTVVATGTRSF